MAINVATRRHFLAGMAIAALPHRVWADAGSPACLAAGKLGEDFVLHGLAQSGESRFSIALPARGHAACAHPVQPLAVVFARRPGTYALVIDCVSGLLRHHLAPPAGRQFNGHGAFNTDGSLLMTSEVVAEGSAGRIGLWETKGFSRVAEWASGGIGPHDLKRLPDGRIVVANGGIVTDPADRSKLNLAAMRPNLSLLSPDGALLEQIELDPALRQNSIRHLALTPKGVAFAMQWEGDLAEAVPPLGLWTPGRAPQLCDTAPQDAFALQGYAGSIAASADGGQIAITSSRGGAVMLFSGDGTPLATHRRPDISGIAAAPDGFCATDGQGVVWACNETGLVPLAQHSVQWDNHLVAIS